MAEPTAALGVRETQRVTDLIAQLRAEGLGILPISHDTRDVRAHCDRVSVMTAGRLVDSLLVQDVTDDEILGMIILGKMPATKTTGVKGRNHYP